MLYLKKVVSVMGNNRNVGQVVKYLTIILTVVSAMLVGYIYWVRNDEGTSNIVYMFVPLLMMGVATISNVVSVFGSSRGRYSVRVVFAYVYMVVSIISMITALLFVEFTTDILVVFLSIVLISLINLFLVRTIELSREISKLSKWFIMGENVRVNLSGHRYVIFYLGVFVCMTICGTYNWITFDKTAVWVLSYIPIFALVTTFVLMSVVMMIDVMVGKLCIRDYRNYLDKLENKQGDELE